jgi:serine/threonine protein kinase
MKTVNGSANFLTNPIGILSNWPIFAKLHNIIMTKLLKPGVGGDFLCTFLNRIECIWFVQFLYKWKDGTHSLKCLRVAPEIPEKRIAPCTQICPFLDDILEKVDVSQDVKLSDVLDSEEPSYGFRCLTRYVDIMCIKNGVPIIPIAFVNSGGERYDMKEAHIINRSRKSLIIQVRHKDEVFKVGDCQSIQNELQKHAVVNGKVPNIIPMVEGAFGNVEGIEGLAFIKLQGCGTCISTIEWEELPSFWAAMAKAISGLHKWSVLHKDVKPENMLLIDKKLVLIDFDISCLESEKEQLMQYVGTPKFQSPWWRKGEAFVPANDWISLGLSFASMLGLEVSGNSLSSLIIDHRTPLDMRNTLEKARHLAILRDPKFLELAKRKREGF